VCWYADLSVKNKNVLDRVVNVSERVIGERQQSLSVLYERRVVKKVGVIVTHVLAQYYELLSSGRRYRVPKVSTVRSRNSFVNKSIEFVNRILFCFWTR
jgi:hypothetical protein